jgi:hypothetical protein
MGAFGSATISARSQEGQPLSWQAWFVINLIRLTVTFILVNLVWAIAFFVAGNQGQGVLVIAFVAIGLIGPFMVPGVAVYIIVLTVLVSRLAPSSARMAAFAASPVVLAGPLWLAIVQPELRRPLALLYFASLAVALAAFSRTHRRPLQWGSSRQP